MRSDEAGMIAFFVIIGIICTLVCCLSCCGMCGAFAGGTMRQIRKECGPAPPNIGVLRYEIVRDDADAVNA